jgi:uncharacterized membrane protein YciS (DUF1049 family)
MDVEMDTSIDRMLELAERALRISKIQLVLWVVALILWVVLSSEYIALKHRVERLERHVPVPTRGTIDNMTI